MVRRHRPIAAVLAVGALVLGLLPVAGSAQATVRAATPVEVPSGWTWTNYGPQLLAVSCITADTCVAVGQAGAVLRSPNTVDVPLAWSFVALRKPPAPPGQPEMPVDLVGVSCSTTSCIAVSSPNKPTTGDTSWVYRSTDRGVTWAAVQELPPIGPKPTALGSAIACSPDATLTADTRVCYIAGTDGGIWRSADDGRSWTGVPVPTTPSTVPASYSAIACARTDFCVGVGGAGAPTSAAIRGTQVTQLTTPVGITKGFAAVACDGPARCVASGLQGNFTVLTVDAGATWGTARPFRKNPKQPQPTVRALTCPVENSCLGLDLDGDALRIDALSDPNATWRMRPSAPLTVGAVDCVATSCVGVGKTAAWYSSFDLGDGFNLVNQVAGFDIATCDAAMDPVCFAGGKENIGRSITGGTLWTLPIADRGALNAKALRCTTPTTCEFFGMTEALATDDLNVFRPRFGPVQSAAGSETQFCVTDLLCVAVNESVVYTTFDGGLTQWSSNQFPKVRPSSMACIPGRVEPVTCLVPNKYNILIGTMTSTTDASGKQLPHWLWRYTNADADELISAVGCSATGTQCTAAGVSGEILTTQDLMNWTQMTIPVGKTVSQLPAYTSVTCPATGFCMVGGKHGVQPVVASTVDNWATYSYDEIADVRVTSAAIGVAGFGCESVNRCVAVGDTALLGLRNPPVGP